MRIERAFQYGSVHYDYPFKSWNPIRKRWSMARYMASRAHIESLDPPGRIVGPAEERRPIAAGTFNYPAAPGQAKRLG